MWLMALHVVSSVIAIPRALKAVNCIPSFKDFSLSNPETFTTRRVRSRFVGWMVVDFRPAFVKYFHIKNMTGHYPFCCGEQLLCLLYCRYRQNMTKKKSTDKILHLGTSSFMKSPKAEPEWFNQFYVCFSSCHPKRRLKYSHLVFLSSQNLPSSRT